MISVLYINWYFTKTLLFMPLIQGNVDIWLSDTNLISEMASTTMVEYVLECSNVDILQFHCYVGFILNRYIMVKDVVNIFWPTLISACKKKRFQDKFRRGLMLKWKSYIRNFFCFVSNNICSSWVTTCHSLDLTLHELSQQNLLKFWIISKSHNYQSGMLCISDTLYCVRKK